MRHARFGISAIRRVGVSYHQNVKTLAEYYACLDNEVTVTPAGRLLVRRVCMVFDRYLRSRTERASYSKVV